MEFIADTAGVFYPAGGWRGLGQVARIKLTLRDASAKRRKTKRIGVLFY
jgi:hypothetical protein